MADATVILIGSLLAFLDLFIVNSALPAMRLDLNAKPDDASSWHTAWASV